METVIPLIPVQRQFQSLKEELLQEIATVLGGGQYIMGPRVADFEQKMAQKIGTRHAVAVANGTDALVLTLKAFGIGEGDEVITTPFTFFATAEAVVRVGATPVFADIQHDTYNLDPEKIAEKITPATKALLPVHLFGQPADMDEIMMIAQEYGLYVIEDACQAFGAEYKKKTVGSIGHAACFSFFPTKNLGTAGDGGLITTNDGELATTIRQLRHHGSTDKYEHVCIGYNSRLDEIHAAMLGVFLEKIDQWNEQRRRIAEAYEKHLGHDSFLQLPVTAPGRTHTFHLYCIATLDRQRVIRQLNDHHIQCGVYYPKPLHLQQALAYLSYRPSDFPVAEEKAETLLAIPMSPFLKDEELQRIVAVLQQCQGHPVE